MEHHDYHELLALHALDALDVSEARALEDHLAGCAECLDELNELRDAASLLAHASTPVAPRPEVRARILAGARAERHRDRTTAGTSPQVVQLRPPADRNTWPNLLRLAAAIAFVALMISTFVLWRRNVRLRQEIAQLSHQVNTQQTELARDREALAREREVIALLSSPDARKTELSGAAPARNARATLIFDRQTGHAVLLTEGLPAPPADKAYELWFIADGHPIPGKVFNVDAAGRATISDQVPSEARVRAVFAVTLEPKGGVSAPTGAIYLSSPSS